MAKIITPFVFGKIATDENFTDREAETEMLVNYFRALTNVIIISPRRWGKSSLVNKASKIAAEQDKDLKICHLDLFNVQNENAFYSLLAKKIISATSSKMEEAIALARKFLVRLVPKISVGDHLSELTFDFDWDEAKQNPDEILNLAERIAVEKNIRIVICIDEFQNISDFDNPAFFQKRLRANWQHHQHVSYCLYGSRKHMMMEIFKDTSKPFYKFGSLIFLNKVPSEYMLEFILRRFKETGKSIAENEGRLIIDLCDNHPYYIQQLSQMSWFRTQERCDEETVMEAFHALLQEQEILFATILEELTSQQIAYLDALVHGETVMSSRQVMKKYNIASSVSASRSKKALLEKNILDRNAKGDLIVQDPIFAYWLKNRFWA